MEKRLFTSECVTCGHPDKVADAISDAILDACLAQDPNARVACETMVTTNFCLICGEITTSAQVDYPAVARQVIREIGYVYPECGFDADTVEIQCRIHTQSADIALGTNDQVGGAGDQGMMFGGACTQTKELMPLPAAMARALANRLTACIRSNDLLRPDGKTQVTAEYDENNQVVGIEAVVVSVMHSADFEIQELRKYIREGVIAPVLEQYGFSGKDPTKVDRSGAYLARYMAKNLVAAGLAAQVQVQMAYAIGVAEPVSVRVDSFGTGVISDEAMTELLRKTCDMTPGGIIRKLNLRRPIYKDTAMTGHFGVENRPWEATDLADQLKELAKSL